MTCPRKHFKPALLAAILLTAALCITGCTAQRSAAAQKKETAETAEVASSSAGESQKATDPMSGKGVPSSGDGEEEHAAGNEITLMDQNGNVTDGETPPSGEEGVGYLAQPGLLPQPSDEFPADLEAAAGLFTYYSQTDERWANSLFGPKDPILTHGCGPTVLAMLVSSYTSTRLDPLAAAVWAAQNGYCIPGSGSSHAIIEGGCKAFGLSAEPVSAHTPEAILQTLDKGRVVVALMGKGYFTDSGHFIIIIRALEDGKVRIADPASLKHCQADWPVDFLISQLKSAAYSGGPLWAVGYQE